MPKIGTFQQNKNEWKQAEEAETGDKVRQWVNDDGYTISVVLIEDNGDNEREYWITVKHPDGSGSGGPTLKPVEGVCNTLKDAESNARKLCRKISEDDVTKEDLSL